MDKQLETPRAYTPSKTGSCGLRILTPDMFDISLPKPNPSFIATNPSPNDRTHIDLATHPRDQHISQALVSPQNGCFTFLMHGPNYHFPFAVATTLALNETSRSLSRGFFHFLPDTADQRFGHICDVLLTDHAWTSADTALWDASSWLQRVELSAVWPFKDDHARQAAETKLQQELEQEQEEKTLKEEQAEDGRLGGGAQETTKALPRPQICPLLPTTKVIPICARFLIPLAHHIPTANCPNDEVVFYHAGAGSPGIPDQLCYTRAQDDESEWLLLFDAGPVACDGEEMVVVGQAKGKRLFSVRSQAFQQRAHCAIAASRCLRYETFTPYRDPRVLEPLDKFFCAHEEGREAARERLGEGRVGGLGDVVWQLVSEGKREAMRRVEREPVTWRPVWWEWRVLRERVKENVRRSWCGVFSKKARRRRRDREQDKRDRRLFGF